jgi:adenylate cyclase
MYLALVRHAEREALKDARAFSSVISIVRSYYASNVSARILAGHGNVVLTERYKEFPGGVPIPATLSIELGEKIRAESVDQSLQFYFVSDAPFLRRARPPLSDFQGEALKAFRRQDSAGEYWRVEDDADPPRLRLALPVRMEAGCVACHNAHPDSPVRNWKVGDVRGIQEVAVDLAILEQADQSGFLAGYMLLFMGSGLAALRESRRNNAKLRRVNEDLEASQHQAE